MNSMNKKTLFAVGSIALTLLSMFLSSKAQEEEIRQIKDELKAELKQEKEN